MSLIARPVIIPSEIQAREFDAKLLLACFLAESGIPVYVGARHEIHSHIHRFPPALYVAKDFRKPSNRIFGIMERLGHKIVAWDEEGLLTFNPEVYYMRRVAQKSISQVREFYAWGKPNRALIENAPDFPGVPVHVTGNPRIDLLRPELRGFHASAVDRLRERFGDFVLINTNFGLVNHLVRSQITSPGEPDPNLGHQPVPELDNFLRHRTEMFKVILDLLPRIASRFPGHAIILRPHPTEDQSVWKDAARNNGNVQVIHEGPVLPWLLAARCMIQNGCTTGLESFLLDRPSIMYEPKDVQPALSLLSDALSHRIDTEPALFERVASCLETGQALPQSPAMWDELNSVLAAADGPLASERIAGHIRETLDRLMDDPGPAWSKRLSGHIRSRRRMIQKSVTARWPGHKTSTEHNRHRFPGLGVNEIKAKIGSLSRALERFDGVTVQPMSGQIFRVTKPGIAD